MGFSKKKIGSFSNIRGWKDWFNHRLLIKVTIVVSCLVIIMMIGKWALTLATGVGKQAGDMITKQVTQIASKQIGEPMIIDEYGNINVMIVGYAGEDYRGGLLTDTIMLASYNVALETVTFLSVPRDLYVAYGERLAGKINGLYRSHYLQNDNDQQKGAEALADKIEQITGVNIPYYAFINFDGFVEFIDQLGGVDIEVPYTLHDTSYPGPNDSYITFHIDGGLQSLDGETALKYARSRKSTSDFSRALRQQQIIQAITDKMGRNAFNITKIKGLYDKIQDVVFTNVSWQNIAYMTKFLESERHYFSYVYSAECDFRSIDTIEPGCELRFGNREEYGGLSVMVPEGASPGNLSYYKNTQDFAFWVVHNQNFLKERASIRVLNGIDKNGAKAQGYNVNGVATDFATELKLRGFLIDDIGNTEEFFENNVIVVPWTGSYAETVNTLGDFIDFETVLVDGSYGSGVSIILGDAYLKVL